MRQKIKASCPDCGEQIEVEVAIDRVTPQRDLYRRVFAVNVDAEGTATHHCPDDIARDADMADRASRAAKVSGL